jgi:hypothetical protein
MSADPTRSRPDRRVSTTATFSSSVRVRKGRPDHLQALAGKLFHFHRALRAAEPADPDDAPPSAAARMFAQR